MALAGENKIAEAVSYFRQAVRLNPNSPLALNQLAWFLATCRDEGVYNPDEAIMLADDACELTGYNDPVTLDTLAAACAAAGKFEDAAATAQQAVDVALSSGRMDLAQTIDNRLELYKAGKPYYRQP